MKLPSTNKPLCSLVLVVTFIFLNHLTLPGLRAAEETQTEGAALRDGAER